MLEPNLGFMTDMLGPVFEQVERPVEIAQLRPDAGGVILNVRVVRIDCERKFEPILGLLGFTKGRKRAGAELRRARAFGVQP